MKKLYPLITCVLAGAIAIFVSIFIIEKSIVLISCLFAVLITVMAAVVRCNTKKCSRFRALTTTTIPAIIYVGLTLTHIPLRIAFHAYRDEFDNVAKQVEQGNRPETPFWIGPFRIKMTGLCRDSVTPYLASNDDIGEIKGFVRNPEGEGFNLWSLIKLDENWAYITED